MSTSSPRTAAATRRKRRDGGTAGNAVRVGRVGCIEPRIMTVGSPARLVRNG